MLQFVKVLLEYVGYFFIAYLMVYATFLFLSVAIGSSVLFKNRRYEKFKNRIEHEYYVPVSIIVPAHNEEITVVETVKSLLQLDYKIYEIIVVDDGSTDNTAKVLIDSFEMQEIKRPINRQISSEKETSVYTVTKNNVSITLICKINGGKADSLNMGINVSKYPYFLCIDADSVLQRDSLKKIARVILEDDEIIACGGMIGISNGIEFEDGVVKNYSMSNNLLVSMQILEYDRSFLASRILLDQINGNLIISGAFGLFKKDMVITVGGYDAGTMGEDMELVVKLHVFCRSHNMKYKIKYASDAICWSQAPSNLKDLAKQRKRWHIGLFQTMWGYKMLFLNYKYGVVSFISFLYFLLYELFSPYIELFGLLTIILASSFNLINVPYMILFFFLYVLYGAVLSITAFFSRCHTQNLKLKISDIFKAVLYCLFEVSVLRFIVAFIRMTALIGYKNKKHRWENITRERQNIVGNQGD